MDKDRQAKIDRASRKILTYQNNFDCVALSLQLTERLFGYSVTPAPLIGAIIPQRPRRPKKLLKPFLIQGSLSNSLPDEARRTLDYY